MNETEITKTERLWAAIGHWTALPGIFPLPFVNVVGPLIVFLMERTESAYAAFHAKQSLYLQVVVEVVVWAGIILGLLIFSLIGFVLGTDLTRMSYLVFFVWYIIRLVGVFYAVLGGVKVYQGAEFEYVLVGPFARTH